MPAKGLSVAAGSRKGPAARQRANDERVRGTRALDALRPRNRPPKVSTYGACVYKWWTTRIGSGPEIRRHERIYETMLYDITYIILYIGTPNIKPLCPR